MITTLLTQVASTVQGAAPPDEKVTPGLVGFLVTFGLVLATVLLMRSMVTHLRKVRYSPDPSAPTTTQATTTPTTTTPVTSTQATPTADETPEPTPPA